VCPSSWTGAADSWTVACCRGSLLIVQYGIRPCSGRVGRDVSIPSTLSHAHAPAHPAVGSEAMAPHAAETPGRRGSGAQRLATLFRAGCTRRADRDGPLWNEAGRGPPPPILCGSVAQLTLARLIRLRLSVGEDRQAVAGQTGAGGPAIGTCRRPRRIDRPSPGRSCTPSLPCRSGVAGPGPPRADGGCRPPVLGRPLAPLRGPAWSKCHGLILRRRPACPVSKPSSGHIHE